MWSMWDAPSDRDYYGQFAPYPDEDELETEAEFAQSLLEAGDLQEGGVLLTQQLAEPGEVGILDGRGRKLDGVLHGSGGCARPEEDEHFFDRANEGFDFLGDEGGLSPLSGEFAGNAADDQKSIVIAHGFNHNTEAA
jgi:hypothetical protein